MNGSYFCTLDYNFLKRLIKVVHNLKTPRGEGVVTWLEKNHVTNTREAKIGANSFNRLNYISITMEFFLSGFH